MRFGYSETCLEHETGNRHPETPDRLHAIRRGLVRKHGVEYVESDPATVDRLAAVHDAEYVSSVRTFCADGGGQWDADTVAVEGTWDAARQSAGLACWTAREALSEPTGHDTPFSLGRPPGHHAVVDDAMGFCFFNNVAVAARAVLDDGDADRVAIVDWDVHHGNGTQDIFFDVAEVFFASIHEAGLYPGTGELSETGTGEGEGTTLNVPLTAGAGDADYLAVLDEAVAPAVEHFDPDLVLVSAGFDAHRHDPISRMRVSTDGFGALTERLRSLADRLGAGLGFVLEGGYSLDMLAESVTMVNEVFDGYDPVPEDGNVDEAVSAQIDTLREIHGLGSK